LSERSLAEIVRSIVDSDPELRACLARGVVNYSELARKLKPLVEEASGLPASVEAVKTALIRYARKLREAGTTPGRRLLEILARSSLELRTNIVVATVRLHALPKLAPEVVKLMGRARLLLILQGINTVTLIVSGEEFSEVERLLEADDIVDIQRNQTVIVVVSPPEVVRTPGFMAYVTGILAANGINISQVESVYTDTILVLSHRDAMKAFTLLEQAVKTARKLVSSESESSPG
jgi:hypothetical protein